MTGTDRAFRVLDVTTTLGGAYASHLLTAGGIDVIRVDPPGGHPLRTWSASGAAVPPGRSGPLFQWLAGGQRAVTVDPAAPDDLDELLAWAATSDVVLWSPGAVVGVEALVAAAPEVTLVSMTPFGLDGPWAGRAATEFTLQALSGAPSLRGSRAWPPLSAGGQHGEYMQGVFAAVAACIALRRAVVTGGGGVIDLSGLEAVSMTQLFNPITALTQDDGVRVGRQRAYVADVVPSEDGYVGFAVVNRVEHWHQFCVMIGRTDWAEDTALDSVAQRTQRSDELNPVIREWAATRTTAEIIELATAMRVPCTEVGNGASIPHMEHFASEPFYDVNPEGGFLQPAAPFRMHPPIPGVGVVAAAPPVGERISAAARPPAPLSAQDRLPSTEAIPPGATAGRRPFDGIRVADFTSFWAGPFFSHTLGMFGADVIHVESTTRPDGMRLTSQHARTVDRWWERSPTFHATNTNKRGVTVDMSGEEGRDLARRLVAECDVLVENYSPRVMDSFGLSWDEVRAVKPDMIMVRMPAFGLSGPWRDRTGFAMTMEQVSGMAWLCGFPEEDPCALFGPCDPGAGLHAVLALTVALEHRRRTGEGRLVECPMVATALNVAAEQVIEHSANGMRLDRSGNRGLAAAPQNSYACADRDDDLGQHRWVSIAVADDDQWRALCRVLGDPPWASDPALDTMAGRRARHDDIDAGLAAWCAERPAAEVVDVLWPAGVPVAICVHPAEQLELEQLHARGYFEPVEHPVHGFSVHVRFPFRLPGEEGPVHRRPAPLLGQHNREVFGGLVGLTDDELEHLERAGVIGTELGL